MRYQLFGGLAVRDEGTSLALGGLKQRSVLAALLVDLGRPVPADRLIDRVWGDHPPRQAETSLQAYVSNLRRTLEPARRPREVPQVLVTQPAGYVLLVDPSDVDAAEFQDLAAAGHARLAAGDTAIAASTLDAALTLWTSPPLPELAGQPWVDIEAVRLAQIRAQVLEDRFEAGLQLGEHAGLIQRIEAAIADEPFRETLHAQLALALYRSGRQRDALASLQAARTMLIDEAGIEPGRRLRQLESDILNQAATLDVAPAAAAIVVSPQPATAELSRATSDAPRFRPGERPFLGRTAELDLLLDHQRRAATGRGGAVVVSGVAGIGKTRLVEELAARLPDAVVAWGRCPESAAQTAYWPWIQIGRQLEGDGAVDGPLLEGMIASGAASPEPATSDRTMLHLSVAELLGGARRPIVIVIDDLQWADPASLRLLEFLAGELRSLKVLVVALTRPVATDASPALVDCLGEVAREPGATRIELDGLSRDDVAVWIAHHDETTTPDTVAAAVHDRTRGNPFFVSEVVELLASEGRLGDAEAARRGTTVPAAVHDVIRRRVGRLPAATQQALAAASVIGRTFDIDVLSAVIERPQVDVLDDIDPAIDAGLLEPTDLPGRVQFSHALVADALAAERSPGRRARLHATVARTIADLRSADVSTHLAELAHHAFEGAPAGTAEEAYEWSVAAARDASSRLAHDDAAEHWGRAVRALELARPRDRRARAEALLEKGRAHLAVDDIGEAFDVLVDTIDLAIAVGADDVVAEAASAMNVYGVWQTAEVGDAGPAAAAISRALDAYPSSASTERVLMYGAVVDAAYWSWPIERLDEVSAEAVAMARTLDDPVVLARALQKRIQAMWWSARLDERVVAGRELLALADQRVLPPEAEALARFAGGGVLWDLGETAATRAHVERAHALAVHVNEPALITQLDFFLGSIAVVAGRYDAAERHLERGYELYRVTRRWAAEANQAGFRITMWMDRGRLEDIRAAAPALLGSPYRPWYKEVYGLALVENGCPDEAAEVCAELPPLTDSWLHHGVLATALHVRAAIGDVAGVTTLRDELRPFAGRMANLGTGPAFGDVDLALAVAERCLGDDDAARRHVDRSVGLLTNADAGPWLARAHLLRASLCPGSAGSDRDQAAAIVERLGTALPRVDT